MVNSVVVPSLEPLAHCETVPMTTAPEDGPALHPLHGHVHDLDWAAMAALLETKAEIRRPFIDGAAHWIAELHRDLPVRRVIDIGAGPGVASAIFAGLFPGAEVLAADREQALLDRAADDLPALLGDADVVWAGQVLHHLPDQREAVRRVAALVRPGGGSRSSKAACPNARCPATSGSAGDSTRRCAVVIGKTEEERGRGAVQVPNLEVMRHITARGILLTIGAVMVSAGALIELAGYTTRNHTSGETNTTTPHRPGRETPWYSESSLPPAAPTTTPRPAQVTAGDPYLAVSYVYRAIANGSATGCALFTPTAAQQFVANFGAPDCPAATDKLHTGVTSAIDYASTGQRSPDVYLGDTMTISSCESKPEGGPLLGRFILQRTNDKWCITGHETEKC